MNQRVDDACVRGLRALFDRQDARGAWAGEVVWNVMLPCQWVITHRILGREVDARRAAQVLRCLRVSQLSDGGWGMHPDSETSWLFHTTLAYVTMRLLGVDPNDELALRARSWIEGHGGLWEMPSWGRAWLAMLGLYPWDFVQPIPPEMWLLPDAAPMHPRRLYCHMRLIYLGMSVAYGLRIQAGQKTGQSADAVALGVDLGQIRDELYPSGYSMARFAAAENRIASTDLFEEPKPALRAAFKMLRGAERIVPGMVRRRAIARAMEHIRFEFESTNGICLSPVNGMLFVLALHGTGAPSHEIERGLTGIEYWMWDDDVEGLRIAGARSDIWDTGFALQVIAQAPPELLKRLDATSNGTSVVGSPADAQMKSESRDRVTRALSWLARAQIQSELRDGAKHYRSPARGGWGFADERHPWPVSDCTAEALEGIVRCGEVHETRPEQWHGERASLAVEFILARQNDDGGFGSYEARRGNMALKNYNPSEIYGNCMLEYSYVECTASCVRTLAFARSHLADQLSADVLAVMNSAIERGVRFIRDQQDPSGGWPGFWGVNFTYGTYFAVTALRAAGASEQDPAITRACEFLTRMQRSDGGWGEHWRGMLTGSVVSIPAREVSHPVQTAWATIALTMGDRQKFAGAREKAKSFLLASQQEDGGWPSPRSVGVFFNTAVLDYRMYRNIFPLWALPQLRSMDEGAAH